MLVVHMSVGMRTICGSGAAMMKRLSDGNEKDVAGPVVHLGGASSA